MNPQIYTREYAEKMLELNPSWFAIAVDRNGGGSWFSVKPERVDDFWSPANYYLGNLGKFIFSGEWKYTLVTRKWIPKLDEEVFVSDINHRRLYHTRTWLNNEFDNWNLENGLVFATLDAAILRTRELLEKGNKNG